MDILKVNEEDGVELSVEQKKELDQRLEKCENGKMIFPLGKL
ncbi:MAG TPA: hypothetical protein PKL31_15090 [Fulvivirga sp.]|nr:hypothetical protein [Fulvivirga sp.]